MRGTGDELSIGERVAFYRQRRGLTQRVLADLVGRSEDWLSKIERGERELRRVDLIADLAGQLRVSVGDLVGHPALMEDSHPQNDDVPAVRAALMDHKRLSPTLFAGSSPRKVDLSQIQGHTDFAWQDFQHGRIGRVVGMLPGLITSAQAIEESGADGLRVSSRIHHLAASTLAKVGESDLAWIAAEAAMSAGERSGDPLALASAARAGTHALLAEGRFDDALQLGQTAASWLSDQLTDRNPEALSLIGMLRLRTAVAAARRQDRPLTTELLNRAERAARAIGRDANHWYTSFGPTNVALHRISTSLDLQDVAYVLAHGPAIDTAGMPHERSVSHRIDLARANAYSARDDEALTLLLNAEHDSPQIVRHSYLARETVKTLHRRARGKVRPALHQLAVRCRAVA